MKVVVYNIAYGTGCPKGEARRLITGHHYLAAPERPLRKIGTFLQGEKPDITGLLEADLGSPRTRGCNQAAILADMTGMTPVYFRKYAPDSKLLSLPYWRSQGNAVLVPDAEPDAAAGFMPHGMKKLVLSVRTCGVRFCLVHLALTYPVRRAQIAWLTEMLEKVSEPVILAGDFNTFRGDGELAELCRRRGLVSANTDGHGTYPAWNPVKVLDHILYSPELELVDFQVPHLPFSDHLPIVADFRISCGTLPARGNEKNF